MEEYGNNGIFGVDRKQTRAVDGKQEIYLEWPNLMPPASVHNYLTVLLEYIDRSNGP